MAALNSRRLRAVFLGVIVAGLGVTLWLLLIGPQVSESARPTVRDEMSQPMVQRNERLVATLGSAVASLAPSTKAPPKHDQIVIDDVSVEKNEVCEGEENLVSVTAHTLDGSDSELHYVIGGQAGRAVPLRAYRLPNGEVSRRTVSVFGTGGNSLSVAVPDYRVKECRLSRSVQIGYRGRANVVDELQFRAVVLENSSGGTPFRPIRYAWTFGDGATAVTSAPYVAHDYSRRSEMEMYSAFLVEARVYSESGESVRGRTSVEFLNLPFEDLRKFGIVKIVAQGSPRFPVLSDDGVVRQTFLFWHYYPEAVNIERIRVLQVNSNGVRSEFGHLQDAPDMSGKTIDPGQRLSVDFSFDTKRNADVIALVYKVEGASVDRRLAYGEVTLMKPPPVPTRANSVPVTSTRWASKIRRAMSILGKASVSEEEVWELERDGALAPEFSPK